MPFRWISRLVKLARIPLATAVLILAGVSLGGVARTVDASSNNATHAAWFVIDSPSDPNQFSVLNDIACAGPSLCFAVGHQYNGTRDVVRIEKWTGSQWSLDACWAFGNSKRFSGCGSVQAGRTWERV